MSQLFLRAFELIIGIGEQAIIIRPPLRIVFSCDKSIAGGLGKLNLQIYNLNQQHREQIVRDKTDRSYFPLVLRCGYENSQDLRIIFKGSIHFATNERAGADFITRIEALDGGVALNESFTTRTVTNKQEAINGLIDDMAANNVVLGRNTDTSQLSRPKVLVGSTNQLIKDLVNDEVQQYYIDNEQIYIIGNDEVISNYVPLVSVRTGLINTPEREAQQVTFVTLINPDIKLGNRVQLESATRPDLNGVYKVITANYNGDYDGANWSETVTGIALNQFNVI